MTKKPNIKNFKKHLTKRNGTIAVIVLLVLLLVGGAYSVGLRRAKTAPAGQSSASGPNGEILGEQGSQTNPDGSPKDTSSAKPGSTSSGSSSSSRTGSGSSSSTGSSGSSAGSAPAAAVENFAGHWYLNFGDITLTQSGANISGTVHSGVYNTNGTISGTISGLNFSGSMKFGSNTISVDFAKSGNTINGYYHNSAATNNKWCGAKEGSNFPSGCGFAGHWYVHIMDNTPSSCEMDLTRVNTTLSGTYCSGRTVSGSINYTGGWVKLVGTWAINPSFTGPLEFYMQNPDSNPVQDSFRGNYSTSHGWCGGVSTSKIPSDTYCKYP